MGFAVGQLRRASVHDENIALRRYATFGRYYLRVVNYFDGLREI
jgi:hypothetical protein